MMKNRFMFLTIMALLFGCNPFNERQNATKKFVKKAAQISKKLSSDYQSQIRDIEPYKVYRYKDTLNDPFRARDFTLQEAKKDIKAGGVEAVKLCLPPECVPPVKHEKTLLEGYNLSSLAFVGTLLNKTSVALIKTPDLGVVEVKVGGYMGNNNGKILEIKKSSIVLQEKILKGGIWKNKKTVMVIKR